MALQVEQVNDASDFDRIVGKMTERILAVGDVDYRSLRAELRRMQGPVQFIFNPEALAKEMARVQGYKDRAVEILGLLTENHVVHKHVVDTLTKGWARLSTEKSAERREGDAILKMSQFSAAASDAEYNYRYALGVVKNMESQLEGLSRQIACVQIAAKIHDPRFAYDSSFGQGADEATAGETRDPQRDGDRVTGWDRFDAP